MAPAMERTIAIYDGFADDPDLLRREARALRYFRSPLNPSNMISAPSRHRKQLARRLAALADRKVAWAWADGAGTYRTTTDADVVRTRNGFFAHSDGIIDYVCLLYLSPEAECHGGTTFCRHLPTGLDGFHDLRAVERVMRRLRLGFPDIVAMVERDARIKRRWAKTTMVEMKSNRLVVYNGRLFHSHVFDFSQVKRASRRLIYMCHGQLG
jgi:hypothetical protein